MTECEANVTPLHQWNPSNIKSTMIALNDLSKTVSYGVCARLVLQSELDPHGILYHGLVELDFSYARGWSRDWFIAWCTAMMRDTVGALSLHIRLFIECIILPRIMWDDAFTLDDVAPIVFVYTSLQGSCSILPVHLVQDKIACIQNPDTFFLINTYVVQNGDEIFVTRYVAYVMYGTHDVVCAQTMIENCMVDAIADDDVRIIELIAEWLNAERDGVFMLVRRVIASQTYCAVIARDYMLHFSGRASSRAIGKLMHVIMVTVPYMTCDVMYRMDTSDSSWIPIKALLRCQVADSTLPWPVPNRALEP